MTFPCNSYAVLWCTRIILQAKKILFRKSLIITNCCVWFEVAGDCFKKDKKYKPPVNVSKLEC